MQYQVPADEKSVFLDSLEGILYSLFDSFSYSSLELLITSLEGNQTVDSIRKPVENVMRAFLLKYPNVGVSSEMCQLSCFLLCISSQGVAFQILSRLFGDGGILPQKLYPKSVKDNGMSFQSEVNILMNYARQILSIEEFSENQAVVLKQLLEIDYLRLCWSLGLSFMNLECFISMFSLVCEKRSFDEFQKILLTILLVSLDYIIETKIDIQKISVHTVTKIKWSDIEYKLRDLEVKSADISTSILRKRNEQ